MKLRRIVPVVAAAAIVSSVMSCNRRENNDSISFEILNASAAFRLENSAKDFGMDSDLVIVDSVSMVMPEIIFGQDAGVLKDSIMSAAFDTVCEKTSDAIDRFYSNSLEDFGYSATRRHATGLTFEYADGISLVTGNVLSLTPSMLTYLVTNYVYYPRAAHGMTQTRYITYYISDARILSLSDLFTPEGLEKLPAMIAARAAKLRSQLGPTDIKALPSTGNFYIDVNGSVVFVYQPYEVASYAQGEITVPFYAYQLSDLMTPEGLKIFGLSKADSNI